MSSSIFGIIGFVVFLVAAQGFAPMIQQAVAQLKARRYGPVPALAFAAAEAEALAESSEIIPDKLIVKEIQAGLGTLLVRERSKARMASGQLIVWASEKKKKRRKLMRLQDGFYDLGLLPATQIDDKVVDEFLHMAINQIRVLKGEPELPAVEVQEEMQSEAAPVPEMAQEAAQEAAQPLVSVEDNDAQEGAIKLKRRPMVSRGKLIEAGVMTNHKNGGEEFRCYGVRFMTPEGVEDELWGRDLQRQLKIAGANVGDNVEILKLGRKTVEKGKAPMNLYRVTKLS